MGKIQRPSLKSLIPGLAKDLRLAPAALYERQRALVRADLLHGRPGRGPGSGVEATPASLALLFISLLATDSLSQTEEATRALAKLKCRAGQCRLTGKKTFGQAVAAVLGSDKLLSNAMFIAARRVTSHSPASGAWATISYLNPSEDDTPLFIDELDRAGLPLGRSVFGTGASWKTEALLHVDATLILPTEWWRGLSPGVTRE